MVRNMLAALFVVLCLLVIGTPAALAQSAPAAESKIDVNSASIDVIEELPGIGIKLAQAIIDGRPYEKVEDLLDVKGIGEKRFAKIKDLVEVVPVDAPAETEAETDAEAEPETEPDAEPETEAKSETEKQP